MSSWFRDKTQAGVPAAALGLLFLFALPCLAITGTQHDDFNDGTSQAWGANAGTTPVANVPDNGPSGSGSGALYMDTTLFGNGRLLVANVAQWLGDWTSALIAKISMDVRNPNAFDLFMHIGIAGPGGVSGGDTHVTPGITVPHDNLWHPITFDILANDFTSITGASNAAALANVTQARITHSPSNGIFAGDLGGAFYLDNIRAIPGGDPVPGDYSKNGTVDAADYALWRDQSGQSGAGLSADGTGPGGAPDGTVNGLDYDFWKARFGTTSAMGGATVAVVSDLSFMPIPEPTSWFLQLALPLIAWRPIRSRS